MQLDHFVVHVDNNLEPLKTLASEIEKVGFPFKPKKGKGTSGFKASNIWVGNQYFEIVRLLKNDGGGWPREWVDRVNNGERGISCIFLSVDDLDTRCKELQLKGVSCSIEKTEFKVLFGLSKMTMPWKYLKLPPIPGTNLDIRFIQYEKEGWEYYQKYMKPNSREFGIEGIFSAEIFLPEFDRGIDYLKKLFPTIELMERKAEVVLSPGKLTFMPRDSDISTRLFSDTKNPKEQVWRLLDLEVQV